MQDWSEAETAIQKLAPTGIRTLTISSYEIPRQLYTAGGSRKVGLSASQQMRSLGAMVWYHIEYYKIRSNRRGGRKVFYMNIDEMVKRWHIAVVGLCLAHDKDQADRYEASIEECLTPILSAPVKQVREFAPKLVEVLKADKRVPFLVWRGYEVWVEQVLSRAADEGVKQLKTELAREITEIVESDLKEQLGEAVIHALQWRDPAGLEKVKEIVQSEKEAGRKVRLRGRESCLFLEAGGTEHEPAVCIQI